VRQHDRPADVLVGLPRIDAEADRDLDGLVELRPAARVDQYRPTASSIA
jgi:hypothetical protein